MFDPKSFVTLMHHGCVSALCAEALVRIRDGTTTSCINESLFLQRTTSRQFKEFCGIASISCCNYVQFLEIWIHVLQARPRGLTMAV